MELSQHPNIVPGDGRPFELSIIFAPLRSARTPPTAVHHRPLTIGAVAVLSIKMPRPLVEALQKRAESEGVPRSVLARRLIEAGLKRRPKA
jgi:Ribbon-helix-helix protein, copG family